MRYRKFERLGTEFSQLILGTAQLSLAALEQSFELLDVFVELGGNILDSANTYGVLAGGEKGDSERLLGRWFEARPGMRERVTVISKGGHPNQDRKRVTPEDVTCDLRDTLARLGSEQVGIYLLHRDDPDVPVGPIVEMLAEHRRAGRIGCYGVSNWTHERIEEADAYAAANGLEPIACSSCNLSLAVQREQMWPGSLSVSDPESRRWHAEHGMPLFAWSAQGGGFFLLPEAQIRSDRDLDRVYGSEQNWERRRRATEFAAAAGCSPNQAALAWVLGQPFPTWAVIGPRNAAEIHDSLGALDVTLTAEQRAWLSLEAEDPGRVPDQPAASG